MLSSLPRRERKKKENPTEQEPQENENEITIRYTLYFQRTWYFLHELTWDAVTVVQWAARTTYSAQKGRDPKPRPQCLSTGTKALQLWCKWEAEVPRSGSVHLNGAQPNAEPLGDSQRKFKKLQPLSFDSSHIETRSASTLTQPGLLFLNTATVYLAKASLLWLSQYYFDKTP